MIESILSNTKIVQFENLSADELDTIVKYTAGIESKPCFICDNRAFYVRDRLISDFNKKLPSPVLDKVFPDPKVSDIMEMVHEVKEKNINVIIGIGGGSTLDSAKAAALVLSNGGSLEDYLGAEPSRKIESKSVKLILIPTTAGTGAEVTKFGVYTSDTGRKYTLAHPMMQADVALLVDEFTYTLPAEITAATAFDALSHALEALWNNNATPISDMISTDAAVSVINWMLPAFENAVNDTTDARGYMLEASCKAGIAFNLTGTAAVHALSFIFSEEWHIPHGIACALTLEDVMLLNCKSEETKSKIVKIAKRVFQNYEMDDDMLVSKFVDLLVGYKKRFELPSRLNDLNIELDESQIENLFSKSLEDPKMKNNIVPVDINIIKEIIKRKI